MSCVICVANQKGGVGKTTTCVNLAAALHNLNRAVLLVDADPQGNASTGMGVDKNTSPDLYDVLLGGVPMEQAIRSTPYGDVVPANMQLSGATVELVQRAERDNALRLALEPVRDRYDYIFIDCPPSLGVLTINALAAADRVLVPVQSEFYAMEGLSDLLTTMKMTTKRINPSLEIDGIVMTMIDRRLSFAEQVSREVRKYFGDQVYRTVIPRNVRIAEAPSHGKPVLAYSRMSRGATAYDCLALEFIKREHKRKKK